MSAIWNSGNLVTLIGGVLIIVGTAFAYLGVYITNKTADERNSVILAQTQEIAALNREIKEHATGGDSYIYFQVTGLGTDEQQLAIRHVGDYPVRDTDIDIFDVTSQRSKVLSGQLNRYDLKVAPRTKLHLDIIHADSDKVLRQYPFEWPATRDYYAYFVHFDAPNGRVRQLLEFVRIDNERSQSSKFDRDENGKQSYLGGYADPAFPADINELATAAADTAG